MPTRSPPLTPHMQAALFARCVELLFSHAKSAVLTALGVGVVFVGLMWDVFPHGELLAWLAVMTVVSLVRLWHVSRYFQTPRQGAEVKHWLIRFEIGSTTAAVLWGMAGVVFMPENQPYHQVVTLMLLTGLSAAAVTAYSSMVWAYRLFLWVSMLPMVLLIFWRGGADYMAIGGVMLFYTVMMSQRAAVMVNRSVVESITHSLRVAELLELNESIINHTDSGIAAYAATGECVFMNSAAVRILGIPAGLDVRDNFRTNPSWQQEGLVEIADQVMHSGKQKAIEFPLHTIYGWDIWIAAKLHRIVKGDQPILLVVFSEISPQRNTAPGSRAEAEPSQAVL